MIKILKVIGNYLFGIIWTSPFEVQVRDYHIVSQANDFIFTIGDYERRYAAERGAVAQLMYGPNIYTVPPEGLLVPDMKVGDRVSVVNTLIEQE